MTAPTLRPVAPVTSGEAAEGTSREERLAATAGASA